MIILFQKAPRAGLNSSMLLQKRQLGLLSSKSYCRYNDLICLLFAIPSFAISATLPVRFFAFLPVALRTKRNILLTIKNSYILL